MLNYLKKLPNNMLYASIDYKVRIVDTTIQKFINSYLCKSFTTIESTEKVIKRKLNFKAKVPIYIDSENIMMCIKSYRLANSFYINYKAIYDYSILNGQVYISFINYHTMRISEKYTFLKQLEKCKEIINFLNA